MKKLNKKPAILLLVSHFALLFIMVLQIVSNLATRVYITYALVSPICTMVFLALSAYFLLKNCAQTSTQDYLIVVQMLAIQRLFYACFAPLYRFIVYGTNFTVIYLLLNALLNGLILCGCLLQKFQKSDQNTQNSPEYSPKSVSITMQSALPVVCGMVAITLAKIGTSIYTILAYGLPIELNFVTWFFGVVMCSVMCFVTLKNTKKPSTLEYLHLTLVLYAESLVLLVAEYFAFLDGYISIVAPRILSAIPILGGCISFAVGYFLIRHQFKKTSICDTDNDVSEPQKPSLTI